ncbi:protein of unknown function [Vibrio tapetis subsp. tapetis]|uniref:Uncharacterized protein n=1 Tax=Vibrio tapetis subsp. tapetis TaxID=1671868 RepID=A0A2N8ZMP7_9VIBR|nr:protein of unknown function [Vibrio tapetis subsp. tapetis]
MPNLYSFATMTVLPHYDTVRGTNKLVVPLNPIFNKRTYRTN